MLLFIVPENHTSIISTVSILWLSCHGFLRTKNKLMLMLKLAKSKKVNLIEFLSYLFTKYF